MTFPSMTEIKEEIFHFLKKHITSGEREGSSLQYNTIEHMAEDKARLLQMDGKNKKNLQLLYFEALNEVFLRGIIARKREEQFFFITEMGKKFLEDQDFDIYDPDLYLHNLPILSNIAESYIKESIHAFNQNLFISSIITLGVSCEAIIVDIATILETKTTDQQLKNLLNSDRSKIDQITRRIDEICSTKKLPYYKGYYQPIFFSMANFIRLSRNQYGHPTTVSAKFQEAYSLLIMFKKYSKLIEEMKNGISNHTF